MHRNTALSAVFFLAILGLAIAGYQTYEYHVLEAAGCDISSVFSCATVTGSEYGAFPPGSGIATAAWGIPWWLTVMLLAGTLLAGKRLFERQELYLFATVASGVVFMVYLLTVEFYILPQQTGQFAICPLCSAQHVLILGQLYLTYTLLPRPLSTYVATFRT